MLCKSVKNISAYRVLMKKVIDFLESEEGLEVVEYAIIMGLVVGAALTLILQLGSWTADQYSNVPNRSGS